MNTLTGLVTDIRTGTALPDVLVTLMAAPTPPEYGVEMQSVAALATYTDTEGQYSFLAPPLGDWLISFQKEPYYPASFNLALWFAGIFEMQTFDVALACCPFPWLWLLVAAGAGLSLGYAARWTHEQNRLRAGALRRA